MKQSNFGWSLRRDPEFFSRAQTVGNRTLVLYFEFTPENPDQDTQFAVIVPKTVAALATKRNLLKRQLKSILRQSHLSGGKFVLVAKRGATQNAFTELRNSVAHLVTKL